MKLCIILLFALCLPSCVSIPFTVAYSGKAVGHTYAVGYSKAEGFVLNAEKVRAQK